MIAARVHGELANWPEYGGLRGVVTSAGMRDFTILVIHVMGTVVRLRQGPGGFRSVVAESALIRHQLQILTRGRQRAPNLRAVDRLAAGLLSHLMSRARILLSAIVLKPSTLLPLHKLLRKRKYRLLFSPTARASSRPEGTEQRTHRRRRGHEAAQSQFRAVRALPSRWHCGTGYRDR